MGREQQLKKDLEETVARGELAGAVVLAYRQGETEFASAGWRDIENHLPMERDTIFRIASMTKPITSVAALMLIEEGRIAFADPISSVAPELEHMRVLRSPDGPFDDTEEASRPITFDDLLTHRAGLTYADFHRGPIAQAYREALGGEIDSDLTPDDWIRGLARLPLIAQPGSMMTYGVATDLLGFLIARIEGVPLGSVLAQRIFEPLGMKDTGFRVPRENWNRRAAAYGFDEQGRLIKHLSRQGVFIEERPEQMAYECGGAGLWSTADDYLKFARIFLGSGEVDGVRLLRPETLQQMVANQLTDEQRAKTVLLGSKIFAVGRGFGFGVGVVLKSHDADMARRGSEGTVSWPGAFGGWWEADPKRNSVFIFLAHNVVNLAQMSKGIGLGVWAAIERAQRVALSD
jgi:CubicO group peptidase (beta-lactamase class C family)